MKKTFEYKVPRDVRRGDVVHSQRRETIFDATVEGNEPYMLTVRVLQKESPLTIELNRYNLIRTGKGMFGAERTDRETLTEGNSDSGIGLYRGFINQEGML